MKKLAISLTLMAALWMAIASLGSRTVEGQQPPKPSQPPFAHSVILYLKKDTPPAKVEELIAETHKVLGKIPTVKGLWVGRRSDKSMGAFADKDFHVGLVLLFDDYDGLKAYEDHPTHVEFVKTYMPIIEKIQVYDFANQAK